MLSVSQEKTSDIGPPSAPQRNEGPFRLLLLVAVVFFSVFGWVFLRKVEKTEWYIVYVRAAERMVRHEKINVIEPVAYAYPPSMAMLTVPLAVVPRFWGMLGWYLINVAATVAVCTFAWKLCGGPSLRSAPGAWWGVFLLGMLLGVRFLIAPLSHQQFDMVIAALILSGCWLLFRGRSMGGGLLIGVAASMKCTPLLFVPYLVWRRKIKAATVVAVVAVGLNLLPEVLFSQSNGRLYVQDWLDSFVSVAAKSSPGSWFTDPTQNQSLGGMVGRLAQFGLPLQLPTGIKGWWTAETAGWARGALWGSAGALLGLTLWFCRRPFQPWNSRRTDISVCPVSGSGETPAQPRAAVLQQPGAAVLQQPGATVLQQPRAAVLQQPGAAVLRGSKAAVLEQSAVLPFSQLRFSLEAAIVVTLMLLLSPMTGKAHFVTMLLPCFLVARLATEQPAKGMRWLLAPLVLFGPILAKDLVGKTVAELSLYWSVPTWFLLVALAWLWWAIVLVGRCKEGD